MMRTARQTPSNSAAKINETTSWAGRRLSHRKLESPIPRILHQTWREAKVPRSLQKIMRSWRKVQPRWAYAFHSDAENANLIASNYPWLVPIYTRLSGVQKADMARYVYMHHFGGVYADLDVKLLRPLRPLLTDMWQRHNVSVLLGQEPIAHAVLLEGKLRQVCNAIIASSKGHPFWLLVLRRAAAAAQATTDPPGSTGPRMLERVYEEWTHGKRKAGGRSVNRRDGRLSASDVRSSMSEGSEGAVMVMPADTFYPTWDPMQEGTFRSRCGTSRHLVSGFGQLAALRRSACERLRREGFRPTVVPSAYTDHRWSHTWIPGAQKVNMWDLVPVEQ